MGMALSGLIETIVSGAVTGGAGAATTLVAFFRDVRKRVEAIEKAIGSAGSSIEPRTGIYLVLEQLGDGLTRAEDLAKKVRKEIDGWEDDPPNWAIKLLTRGQRTGSFTNEALHDTEQRIEQRVRGLMDRLQELENTMDQTMRKIRVDYIERAAYEEERRKRDEELRKVKENIHTANGFLRGVMAALGYLEDNQPPTVPSDPPPPFKVPRPPLPSKPKGK
jgi:chromosome segregation ATPase